MRRLVLPWPVWEGLSGKASGEILNDDDTLVRTVVSFAQLGLLEELLLPIGVTGSELIMRTTSAISSATVVPWLQDSRAEIAQVLVLLHAMAETGRVKTVLLPREIALASPIKNTARQLPIELAVVDPVAGDRADLFVAWTSERNASVKVAANDAGSPYLIALPDGVWSEPERLDTTGLRSAAQFGGADGIAGAVSPTVAPDTCVGLLRLLATQGGQ